MRLLKGLPFVPGHRRGPETVAETLVETPLAPSLERIGERMTTALDTLDQAARLYPNLPWEIGFSGGKDSSVTAHLVFEYVRQAQVDGSPLPPKVYLIYSDTLLDVPILRRHTLKALEEMRSYSRRFGNLLEVRILKPAEGKDYFSLVVEQGYSVPHFRFRWCMDRLKIDPTVRFLASIGEFAMVTGVRRDESPTRRRNMNMRKQTEPIAVVDGVPMIAPLLSWSQEDVWDFLKSFRQPWNGEAYSELFDIYRLGDNLEGCGRCAITPNSRFGCWVCTVVHKDKMLTNLASRSNKYRTMLESKEAIRRVSLKGTFRELGPEGSYKKLNQAGRLEVIGILAEAYLNAEDALQGYLEDPALRLKLESWFEQGSRATGNPRISEALVKLRSG